LPALPADILNVPSVLVELEDQRTHWQPGQLAHVVNLSLLPLTPNDIAHLDHQLGTGRVLILSRGYGNCRITNCMVPNTWRVVYYNSQDAVILNSVEVCDMPEVACAAPEDLLDSVERLTDVLQWVSQA
jgi:hydrogenase-1 operon protein HyaF